MLGQVLLWAAVGVSHVHACPTASNASNTPSAPKLRVESFVNFGQSFDMVSSLIIGSKAAVVIDLPLAIPQAAALAAWVKNTTDKPLAAVFSTHFHPDHYLSGAAFLQEFPQTPFYSNAQAIGHMKNEVSDVAKTWAGVFGQENIVSQPTVPKPYNSSTFTLPGNEDSPIHLLSPPVVGDTVDETLFWIPSISTLIAGDSVIGDTIHIWVADLLTPALTAAWLQTLDFIEKLALKMVIPGHAVTTEGFGPTRDLEYSKKYLRFYQKEVEAKGIDFYTPEEIVRMFDDAFPGLTKSNISTTAALILNFTGQEFGRGGNRFAHHVDLKSFTNITQPQLEVWQKEFGRP